MARRSEPERTCVGCRLQAPKGSLIRLVRTPAGDVRLDPGGKEAGRGAYLHPVPACLAAGLGRGSIARALRTRLEPAVAARLMDEATRTLGEHA